MAKLQNGIFKDLSGSIGDLNFYKWKNTVVLRAKRSPSKKKPTQAQIIARDKFKLLSSVFRGLSQSAAIGFKSHTSSMSERNAFFKYNHSSILNLDGELKTDYPQLVLSEGTLKGIEVVSASPENFSFQFQWKNKSITDKSDTVYLVLLPLNENYRSILTQSSGKEECLRVKFPSFWNGAIFHAYTFRQNQKQQVSNSQYLGEFCNYSA